MQIEGKRDVRLMVGIQICYSTGGARSPEGCHDAIPDVIVCGLARNSEPGRKQKQRKRLNETKSFRRAATLVPYVSLGLSHLKRILILLS